MATSVVPAWCNKAMRGEEKVSHSNLSLKCDFMFIHEEKVSVPHYGSNFSLHCAGLLHCINTSLACAYLKNVLH